MSEDRTLLWEVGCEELPAWACDTIERQLPALVHKALVDARLAVSESVDGAGAEPVVWVGPRRFSVLVEALPFQRELREESRGPALKAAYTDGDPNNEPTKACIGFAHSKGVAITELEVREDNGREFVYAVRDLPIEPLENIWPDLAANILNQLQFAKPMRWGSSPWRFVRPIRWMATLHGAHAMEYSCWGVESTRSTRTHRFLGAERTVALTEADTYAETLRNAKVLVDQKLRRSVIEKGLTGAADTLGGRWDDPGRVLNEVVHLVEAPTVITGHFADRYLELPERVLVTAMQSHQRYFPVLDADSGRLLPNFLTVMNGDPAALDSILPGYERVLAGRLDDAVFSFDRDRERGLDDMATDASLGAVVFHAKAGSLADRRERIAAVAEALAKQLDVSPDDVNDAARLAKADQVSVVVQEFSELEGYVGSLYAQAAGYSTDVCAAIDQQFLPRGLESSLPDAGVPSVIALADKLELLLTMFAIGEHPTGSRDPHGLRRAAIGITRIILEHDHPVDIAALIDVGLNKLAEQGITFEHSKVAAEVYEFLLDRIEKQLSDEGVRVDAARAARKADVPHLQHIYALARALDREIRGESESFKQVIEAQERSRKLLTKADDISGEKIDEALFEADSERELFRVLNETRDPLSKAVEERAFDDAVALAAAIGPAVDAFFARESGVMIMSDDAAIRRNRLLLLADVVSVTQPLGDLAFVQV